MYVFHKILGKTFYNAKSCSNLCIIYRPDDDRVQSKHVVWRKRTFHSGVRDVVKSGDCKSGGESKHTKNNKLERICEGAVVEWMWVLWVVKLCQPWRWTQCVSLKQYLSTSPQGVTTQKKNMVSTTAMKTFHSLWWLVLRSYGNMF